ncbi:pilus assembly protein TadG [Sinorhizobium fredii USDA 205]|uniref:Pilus assembly protein n=1 Tax=Rhizobium fredii TaxID=380 RepID=A0A844AG63_RHIFR|nr:TadE/TadG family type IV pilus assembly protein [Sinorhizobium fredii]KSV83334.1 pilus assembly protein TadG [Sinorhizobium fredii USDA 205]MQX11943.1 pilus assembly protein [Sinorhizobium fredii]GEC33804.1 pilus assembly protein TadG [Sinorhizobium fredii]GLS08904.1 pilus assembly protein TadG [Sinorhizobium fredii]
MATNTKTSPASRRGSRQLFRRLLGDRRGATAIEFAILALPFFIVVFASIETFVAFAGEQLLANATDTLARKIRTGEITKNVSEAEFRQAFCDEIAILLTCSATEVTTPEKLYLDVRQVADPSQFPAAVPRVGPTDASDLDTSGFQFAPGAGKEFTMVRAYYRWQVITDLVRPYVTNLRPAGSSMPRDYLMVATATFRNEDY